MLRCAAIDCSVHCLHFLFLFDRAKNSLFGEGIYLSPELGVCLTYSSRGLGWQASQLGSCLACVCLAQVSSVTERERTLLEIPDTLVRIRIRGSLPNGPGSSSGRLLSSVTLRMQRNFFFLLHTRRHIIFSLNTLFFCKYFVLKYYFSSIISVRSAPL